MFRDKLKILRKNNGYSMDKLAEIYNVKFNGRLNKSTISRYESGTQEPMYSVVKNFAELFGVTVDYLSNNENTNFLNCENLHDYKPTHTIPVLGCISAGLPLYAEEHIIGYTETDLNSGGEYFALKVRGDSMTAARIYEDDTLIIRVQPCVENGEIAVIRVNGDEATVKRFFIDGNTVTLMPQSHNPEHQAQIYDIKFTPIEVLGKVVRNQIEF